MSVNSTESKRYRHFFEWLVYAIFVVPYAQIKIFDLPYQLYTFDVFHKKEVNRWSHFIGIPLNLIVFDNAVWYLSPVFHFLFWPFVQYITHSIEPYIPRPWSVRGNWSKLTDIIKEREWYIIVAIILMIPFNTFVELISSWRNLYIEILQFSHKAGYRSPALTAMTQWIEQEVNSDDPIYDYTTFKEAFKPYFDET